MPKNTLTLVELNMESHTSIWSQKSSELHFKIPVALGPTGHSYQISSHWTLVIRIKSQATGLFVANSTWFYKQ